MPDICVRLLCKESGYKNDVRQSGIDGNPLMTVFQSSSFKCLNYLSTLCVSLLLMNCVAVAAEPLCNNSKGRYHLATQCRANALTEHACELINRQEYAGAVEHLEGALLLKPDMASAHANLGLALNRMGKVEEAISHLRTAVRLAPREAAPLLTLANAYQRTGQLDAALYAYARFALYFPNDKDIPVVRGLIAGLKKELERGTHAHDTASTNYTESATGEKSLRWDRPSRQLKVHISSGADVRGPKPLTAVENAFRRWESIGCFTFVFVNEPGEADIVCRWVDQANLLANPAEGGEARLTFKGSIISKAKLTLLTMRGDAPADTNEVAAVALHEVGHCLGIVGHSPSPSDVMYFAINPDAKGAFTGLSSRDVETLRKMYPVDPVLSALGDSFQAEAEFLPVETQRRVVPGGQRGTALPIRLN